ncbi:hypothetical protein HY448_00805 [Candidatus Pacearchaeota archaeon]|nr:hypothetical protein [Candidatus Pacearchaeota archaeon]
MNIELKVVEVKPETKLSDILGAEVLIISGQEEIHHYSYLDRMKIKTLSRKVENNGAIIETTYMVPRFEKIGVRIYYGENLKKEKYEINASEDYPKLDAKLREFGK